MRTQTMDGARTLVVDDQWLARLDADIPEIDAIETKLATARQIKQGMMQELLTGRIRLV